MRTFVRMFVVLAVFFAIATVAYALWSWLYDLQQLATDPSGGEGRTPIEWVGTTALGLSAVFALLIAFYLARVRRSPEGADLPEDRDDADVDDGEAEQGQFSPWSWWPITLAGACALVMLGLAVGAWISIIGAGILVVALVGWVYEYYRGYFGR